MRLLKYVYEKINSNLDFKELQKYSGGGDDDWQEFHRWMILRTCEQRYSGRCNSSGYSLQDNCKRACLRNEVPA